MRIFLAVSFAVLLIAGFLAYQSPRVQELFQSTPAGKRLPPPPVPEEVKVSVPAPSEAATKNNRQPKPVRPASRPQPAEPAPLPKPTVANSEVTSVLLGIFAARQIKGLSLSVTDEVIEVAGTVESEQQRQQVLNTIEKARETRRVDASQLKVRQ